MLSRLLDPDDAHPRGPFWLAAAAVAAAQLLALHALCSQQVRQAADERGVEANAALQPVPRGCLDPTSADCAAFHGPGPASAPVAFASR